MLTFFKPLLGNVGRKPRERANLGASQMLQNYGDVDNLKLQNIMSSFI